MAHSTDIPIAVTTPLGDAAVPSAAPLFDDEAKTLHKLCSELTTHVKHATATLQTERAELTELKVALETEIAARRQALETEMTARRQAQEEELSAAAVAQKAEIDAQREACAQAVAAHTTVVAKWEAEQEHLKNTYDFGAKIVKLNVGGVLLTTRLKTLQDAGGFLSGLFSGRFEPDRDEDGNIFIDLNGEHFKKVIDLIRHEGFCIKTALPAQLRNICKYLQIGGEELFTHSVGDTIQLPTPNKASGLLVGTRVEIYIFDMQYDYSQWVAGFVTSVDLSSGSFGVLFDDNGRGNGYTVHKWPKGNNKVGIMRLKNTNMKFKIISGPRKTVESMRLTSITYSVGLPTGTPHVVNIPLDGIFE